MLRQMEALEKFKIIGKDGEVGELDDFFFDDGEWTVRELVIRSGDWLSGSRVLILPHSVIAIDTEQKAIAVSLTRQQIEEAPAPPAESEELLGRYYEALLYEYYAFPFYWLGPEVWGYTWHPNGVPIDAMDPKEAEQMARLRESRSARLRSFNIVNGFSIACVDGSLGDVEDMIFDDENWTIQYIVVDTHKFLPSKNVLVPPRAVQEVAWQDATMHLDMKKADLKALPSFQSLDDVPAGSDMVAVGRAA